MRRRFFSRAFKLESVKLVKGRSATALAEMWAETAKERGVSENVLRRWCRESSAAPREVVGTGGGGPQETERLRLRRELAQTQAEIDALEKSIEWFEQNPE